MKKNTYPNSTTTSSGTPRKKQIPSSSMIKAKITFYVAIMALITGPLMATKLETINPGDANAKALKLSVDFKNDADEKKVTVTLKILNEYGGKKYTGISFAINNKTKIKTKTESLKSFKVISFMMSKKQLESTSVCITYDKPGPIVEICSATDYSFDLKKFMKKKQPKNPSIAEWNITYPLVSLTLIGDDIETKIKQLKGVSNVEMTLVKPWKPSKERPEQGGPSDYRLVVQYDPNEISEAVIRGTVEKRAIIRD